MDSEYIYLVAAYNYKPYLYIFTNPLNGELSYDDEGQPVVETPELVSGPTMIANGCTNVDQVWTLNRLPYLKKIGNYIIFVNTMRSLEVSYVDVSDPRNPVKNAYTALDLFTYKNENGENVTLDTASYILGVEFDGTTGYFTVSDNVSSANWLNAHLIKVDFKYPTSPVVLGEVTLETGDTTVPGGNGAGIPVSITGGNIYLSIVNRGKLNRHFWKINPDTLEIIDEIKGTSAPSGASKFYDTGDMLIVTSGDIYSGYTGARRFGEKDAETGMTTVTSQTISAMTNQQGQTKLDAFAMDIIPYGTKLYFPFALGGAYGKNQYKQATVGYIDMAQFNPFTFTVNEIPAVAYDSYTVSGSITTPATAFDCGVHLYINGSTVPVDAEIIYDTVYGSVISKWQYTLEGAGVYNITAKVYDEYGDYDNITENMKVTIKSTNGLNAETKYSVVSDEHYVTIPETVKKITAEGFSDYPETWVTGYDYRSGYLAMSMTNRGVQYTSTKNTSADKDAETGDYVIDENKVRLRNQLVFYNLNSDGSIGTEAKVYDGVDLGMSQTIAWNQPGRYTSLSGIYGMTMDDDYVYIYANEPRKDHYVVDYYLYIYENPYNRATDSFDDTLTRVGRVNIVSGGNANAQIQNNMGAYDDMQKITYDGKEYIAIADIYSGSYAVVDVTDKTAPVRRSLTGIKSFTHNGLSMSAFSDMEFDGNYAYVTGQNNGTITEATDETEASISGAYYVMYKVDFSNPTAPEVVNSWKLLDADFDYLNRKGHSSYATRTTLYPQMTLDISGGKVIATLSTTEQYLQSSLAEKIGSLKAYVLENGTITPLSAGAVTTGNTVNGASLNHTKGSEHVYFVNGMYYAYKWDKYDNGRRGGNYVVGYPAEFEANAASASRQTYPTGLKVGARLLSAFEIDGRIYTNYWLAYADGTTGTTGTATTYGAISCMDFTDLFPYLTKLRIDDENTYYAEVALENKSATQVGFTPVAALYKSGQLIDVAIGSEASVKAGGSYSEKLALDVPSDTDYSDYIIKTFIFEDMINIKPLTMGMSIKD